MFKVSKLKCYHQMAIDAAIASAISFI